MMFLALLTISRETCVEDVPIMLLIPFVAMAWVGAIAMAVMAFVVLRDMWQGR